MASRVRNMFVAEVRVATGDVTPIVAGKYRLHGWDGTTGVLVVTPSGASGEPGSMSQAYKRERDVWVKTIEDLANVNSNEATVEVSVDVGPNSPPKIVATNRATQERTLVRDLNPEFKHLTIGTVESVLFRASDGHEVKAGIFFPPNFSVGRKYPLVIQTHGWKSKEFYITGPFESAFAARPLAARGILVIQLDEDYSRLQTAGEVPYEAASYVGAIDYLLSRNLIDGKRIGVIGFSRTGLAVEYALIDSKYHFTAATLADTSDLGYFRYLAFLNTNYGNSADNERINGGPPFGEGLRSWLNVSPDFNLDKIETPVRIEAYRPGSLFFCWEWFTGLSRLGKPVELIYMPDADHGLVKPWNRLVSQQGNVDWFDFWLNGHEDPDPAKREQYQRWRELRKLQQAQDAERASATKE